MTKTNGNDLVRTPMNTLNAKGLTKREYFAAMALQGLLARKSNGSVYDYADVAVCQADALISELNKQSSTT